MLPKQAFTPQFSKNVEWKDRVRDIGGCRRGYVFPADPVVTSQAPSQLRILIMFTEPWLRDFHIEVVQKA